jgi:hypothetical protein
MTKSNYLSFWEYLKKIKILWTCTGGHINLLLSVRPSGCWCMVFPTISSYRFGAIALIFCRMCIHIMEVYMSTGFWFSSNILKMTGSWTWSFCSSVRKTMHQHPDGRTDRSKLICPPTLRRGGIKTKTSNNGIYAQVYKGDNYLLSI